MSRLWSRFEWTLKCDSTSYSMVQVAWFILNHLCTCKQARTKLFGQLTLCLPMVITESVYFIFGGKWCTSSDIKPFGSQMTKWNWKNASKGSIYGSNVDQDNIIKTVSMYPRITKTNEAHLVISSFNMTCHLGLFWH